MKINKLLAYVNERITIIIWIRFIITLVNFKIYLIKFKKLMLQKIFMYLDDWIVEQIIIIIYNPKFL